MDSCFEKVSPTEEQKPEDNLLSFFSCVSTWMVSTM